VDRGQPGVAAADAVPASTFEVVEERANQRRVEVFDLRASRCGADAFGEEDQQQSQRVAIAGDGVWAGVLVPGEPLGEEGLQRRGKRGHDTVPIRASSRVAASASSSGAADRYQ
jgi:hypothetical protein